MSVALVKDGWGLLTMFGLPSSSIANAQELGVLCSVATNGLTFKYGDSSKFVAVKPVTLSLLKAGTIGASAKAATAALLGTALAEVVSTASAEGPTAAKVDDQQVDTLGAAPSQQPPGTPQPNVALTVPTAALAVPQDKVPLSAATYVHQRVEGTSSNTVYRVVILASDVAVAFRLNGYKLSIRVEGLLDKYAPLLAGWGFDMKGSYMSAHLKVPMDPVPRKHVVTRTLGAMCASIGFHNLVAVANMDLLFEEAKW